MVGSIAVIRCGLHISRQLYTRLFCKKKVEPLAEKYIQDVILPETQYAKEERADTGHVPYHGERKIDSSVASWTWRKNCGVWKRVV